jgi:hypothetical protein
MSHQNDYDFVCERLLFDLLVREMSFGVVIFSFFIDQFMSHFFAYLFCSNVQLCIVPAVLG